MIELYQYVSTINIEFHKKNQVDYYLFIHLIYDNSVCVLLFDLLFSLSSYCISCVSLNLCDVSGIFCSSLSPSCASVQNSEATFCSLAALLLCR